MGKTPNLRHELNCGVVRRVVRIVAMGHTLPGRLSMSALDEFSPRVTVVLLIAIAIVICLLSYVIHFISFKIEKILSPVHPIA